MIGIVTAEEIARWAPGVEEAYTYLSICSRHQEWDPDCDLCQHGVWSDDRERAAEHVLFKTNPHEWLRRANRRDPEVDE